MPLRLPFVPPFDAVTYPVAEPYQASNPDPAAWRLRIAAERPASATLNLIACCDAVLSTVPPDELPPDWYGLATLPDGQSPAVVRLYLKPAGPARYGSLRDDLSAAHLGSAVLWFVYENVDAATLSSAVTDAVDTYVGFDSLTLHGKKLTTAQKREAFLEGQLSVWVAAGTVLGRAAASETSGPVRAEFGVRTDRGYVDPVAFFRATASQLESDTGDATNLAAFASLITSSWPVLGTVTDAGALMAAAATQLYPLPVLQEAGERLGQLANADFWRLLADRQKTLYWAQLRVRAGFDLPGIPFTFSTDDMANPFQLEAVTEFFLTWGTVGRPASLPTSPGTVVDLLAGTWNLVFIDPFDHDLLGHPELPRPDYTTVFYSKTPTWCDDSAAPSPVPDPADPSTIHPLANDRYGAVLFVLHAGQVVGWYRWTTYTSHVWEISTGGSCNQASSIQGNLRYAFRSRTSPIPGPDKDGNPPKQEKIDGSHHRNYNFVLLDTDPVRNPPRKGGWQPDQVPGRYYFRPGMPIDDGKVNGDSDPGKGDVLIHNGNAVHNRNSVQDSTGSGGCLVSPEFYSMRAQVVSLYEADYRASHQGKDDLDVLPVMNLNLGESQALHKGEVTIDGTPYPDEHWDGKIAGAAYVIRPDEPAQK